MMTGDVAFTMVDGGQLRLCLGQGEPVFATAWEFSFVSSVRWCARHGRVLVTATPAGGRPPSVKGSDRGELALFAWTPGDDRWEPLYRGYAHDPVCLSGGGYAVHRGAGLTFLDASGRRAREVKIGQFSWGPPSLSVRPSGDLVAWIRWRGDNRRLCLEDPAGTASADLGTSVYQYAWLGDDTIVYYLGAGLRLLDIASGRSRRLAPDLGALIGAAAGLPDRAARYLNLPAAKYAIDGVRTAGARLWFTLTLFVLGGRQPRYTGLFARDAATGATTLLAEVHPEELIESFTCLPGDSAVLDVARYQGTRVIRREQRLAGPLAPFLTDGWRPLPGCADPEFGFHAMP